MPFPGDPLSKEKNRITLSEFWRPKGTEPFVGPPRSLASDEVQRRYSPKGIVEAIPGKLEGFLRKGINAYSAGMGGSGDVVGTETILGSKPITDAASFYQKKFSDIYSKGWFPGGHLAGPQAMLPPRPNDSGQPVPVGAIPVQPTPQAQPKAPNTNQDKQTASTGTPPPVAAPAAPESNNSLAPIVQAMAQAGGAQMGAPSDMNQVMANTPWNQSKQMQAPQAPTQGPLANPAEGATPGGAKSNPWLGIVYALGEVAKAVSGGDQTSAGYQLGDLSSRMAQAGGTLQSWQKTAPADSPIQNMKWQDVAMLPPEQINATMTGSLAERRTAAYEQQVESYVQASDAASIAAMGKMTEAEKMQMKYEYDIAKESFKAGLRDPIIRNIQSGDGEQSSYMFRVGPDGQVRSQFLGKGLTNLGGANGTGGAGKLTPSHYTYADKAAFAAVRESILNLPANENFDDEKRRQAVMMSDQGKDLASILQWVPPEYHGLLSETYTNAQGQTLNYFAGGGHPAGIGMPAEPPADVVYGKDKDGNLVRVK